MMLLGTLILRRPSFGCVDGLAKSTAAEASLFGSGYAGLGNLCTSRDASPGASRHPLPVGEGWSRESLLPVGQGARRADEGRYVPFFPDVHDLCRGSLDANSLARRSAQQTENARHFTTSTEHPAFRNQNPETGI